MKDNLSRIMDRFNWWLFTADIKTVQEVRNKWLEFKQEYHERAMAELEELKNKGEALSKEIKAKGVTVNAVSYKKSN